MTHSLLLFHQQDALVAQQLELQLQPLEKQHLLRLYSSNYIKIGSDYDMAMRSYGEKATHCLYLVSIDSITDTAMYNQAVEAMHRNKQVWLILAKPCLWKNTELCNCPVMVNKPISQYEDRDLALSSIAIAIAKRLDPNYNSPLWDEYDGNDDKHLAATQQQIAGKIYNIDHIDKANFS